MLPHPQRANNLDRIAGLAGDFDVVGLQEVDAGSLRSGYINQTEYLSARAGFPYWYSQTNRNIGRIAQHSIGVLSRHRPTEVIEHSLPGRIPGRGALELCFGTGRESLSVLVVHLALGRRARLDQLAYLAERINTRRHAILMGDLNCRSRSREMDLLIHQTLMHEPTHGLNTFPSWKPYRNIDHILVTPTLHIEAAQVLDYPLSDHLPIAMNVRLPESLRLER